LAPTQNKNTENRQKEVFENEVRDLLKLLGTVQPGELQYGIQKIFNPRTKLIEGAGMISMKTLKEYGDQINNRKKVEDERKVVDSLSFIKENQINFNKKNNVEEFSIDRNLISSGSFLQTHESHLQNNPSEFKNDPKRSLTINAGKLIVKSINTGHILMNEFEYKNEQPLKTENINNSNLYNNNKSNEARLQKSAKTNESAQNMSLLFKSISRIEDKKIENTQEQSMLSSSQNSLFLGAGKTLLKKIDEEYLKIIGKKNI